jgi:hypothetical protein
MTRRCVFRRRMTEPSTDDESVVRIYGRRFRRPYGRRLDKGNQQIQNPLYTLLRNLPYSFCSSVTRSAPLPTAHHGGFGVRRFPAGLCSGSPPTEALRRIFEGGGWRRGDADERIQLAGLGPRCARGRVALSSPARSSGQSAGDQRRQRAGVHGIV